MANVVVLQAAWVYRCQECGSVDSLSKWELEDVSQSPSTGGCSGSHSPSVGTSALRCATEAVLPPSGWDCLSRQFSMDRNVLFAPGSLYSLRLLFCCPSSWNNARGRWWCSIKLSWTYSRFLFQHAPEDTRTGPTLPKSVPKTLRMETATATKHRRRKPWTFFRIHHLWSIADYGLRISSNLYIFSLDTEKDTTLPITKTGHF